MHRERRTSSKVCQQRWDEHNQAIHADKLRSIKPSIDNSPPKAQKHLQNRRKRDQIKEDRLATIERDNLLLLDKMMNIMQKPSATTMTMSGGGGGGRSMSPSKSLNADARRREFQRINDDNQMILKKLTTAKSHYDRKEWEQFETNQTKYLENICEYPVQKHLPKISTSLPQIRSSSRVNTKSFSSPERSAPSSPTIKKKATHQIKQKGPTKEYSQEQQYFSDDSLSLSDLDSASDEEFLKGIAKLETNTTNGKNKKEDAGSDADSLGSDFSDSFEDESDHEGNAKSASSKSENDLDSPKANSARKDSRPDSAKSGGNEVGTPKSGRGEVHGLKSSGDKPTSARSNGSPSSVSSVRETKSTGTEHKKSKEEESEDEEEYENEFEDEDGKD